MRTNRGFLASLKLKDGSTQMADQAMDMALDARNACDDFFDASGRWFKSSHGNGRVREPEVVRHRLGDQMKKLGDQLKLLKTRAAGDADEFELNSYAERCLAISREVETLVGQTMEGFVYWVEPTQAASRFARAGLG